VCEVSMSKQKWMAPCGACLLSLALAACSAEGADGTGRRAGSAGSGVDDASGAGAGGAASPGDFGSGPRQPTHGIRVETASPSDFPRRDRLEAVDEEIDECPYS
jgi:hypothetical protein